MHFSLNFSRKTWYSLLVIATAFSMSAGFAALAGADLSMLNVAAFGIMGMAVLFLAAEKDNDKKLRGSYFQSFLLGMLGYAFGGVLGLVGACLAWPMLLYTEQKRGAPLARQLQLLIFAEGAYALLWCLAANGVSALYFYVNLFALLKSVARGWAAYTLLRWHKQGSDA